MVAFQLANPHLFKSVKVQEDPEAKRRKSAVKKLISAKVCAREGALASRPGYTAEGGGVTLCWLVVV